MNPVDILELAGPRALSDDLPEELRKDLCNTGRFRAFRKANEMTARMRYHGMLKVQEAVGADLWQNEEKAVEGLGEHYMRIPQDTYLAMRRIHGDACWGDADFVKSFRRDNPWCIPRITRGTKGQEIRK